MKKYITRKVQESATTEKDLMNESYFGNDRKIEIFDGIVLSLVDSLKGKSITDRFNVYKKIGLTDDEIKDIDADFIYFMFDKFDEACKQKKKAMKESVWDNISDDDFDLDDESDSDDDISDEEYRKELEKHISEIPTYDDTQLKNEYREFKNSTHEDDKRIEKALKRELIKRNLK